MKIINIYLLSTGSSSIGAIKDQILFSNGRICLPSNISTFKAKVFVPKWRCRYYASFLHKELLLTDALFSSASLFMHSASCALPSAQPTPVVPYRAVHRGVRLPVSVWALE